VGVPESFPSSLFFFFVFDVPKNSIQNVSQFLFHNLISSFTIHRNVQKKATYERVDYYLKYKISFTRIQALEREKNVCIDRSTKTNWQYWRKVGGNISILIINF
jgi:hypothetical protein